MGFKNKILQCLGQQQQCRAKGGLRTVVKEEEKGQPPRTWKRKKKGKGEIIEGVSRHLLLT